MPVMTMANHSEFDCPFNRDKFHSRIYVTDMLQWIAIFPLASLVHLPCLKTAKTPKMEPPPKGSFLALFACGSFLRGGKLTGNLITVDDQCIWPVPQIMPDPRSLIARLTPLRVAHVRRDLLTMHDEVCIKPGKIVSDPGDLDLTEWESRHPVFENHTCI